MNFSESYQNNLPHYLQISRSSESFMEKLFSFSLQTKILPI